MTMRMIMIVKRKNMTVMTIVVPDVQAADAIIA